MILEEETFEKYGYYARDLAPQSKKKVVAACCDCGKIRVLSKPDSLALCLSCAKKGKRNTMFGKHHSEEVRQKISQNRVYQKGEDHPNYKHKIKCICFECGDVFLLKPGRVQNGRGKFCSRECKEKWQSKYNKGKNNPAWKGGKVRRECQVCGKEFEVAICEIKKGWGKYCSRKCQTRGIQRKKSGPTKPERIFEDICKRNNLPFHFVGDRSLWIGNANPDFIHNTRKLVCEVFGDYWHSPLLRPKLRYNETLDGRRQQLKAEGYKLVVFWETDLLREDAEAFVLNTLQKLRI